MSDDPENRCYLHCDGFWRCLKTGLEWSGRNIVGAVLNYAGNIVKATLGAPTVPYESHLNSPFVRACYVVGGKYHDGFEDGPTGGNVLPYCNIPINGQDD